MKSYVITIMHLNKSVEIANRCIESGKIFGIDIEFFPAITPKDDVYKLAKKYSINIDGFDETYSRKENAISCFLSHYMLWKKSIELNEKILIFEHDAVVIDKIDLSLNFSGLLSLGKPSYGKFNIPKKIGINTLSSKNYIPGAHAYMLQPSAAKQLIERSKILSCPTDVFIDKRKFSWIQEYYPWPVEAHDTFTTVQKITGCIAKHNYTEEGFKII